MKFAAVRTFALALPDASEARREEALELHSAFAEKLRWGGKVVGVRLQLAGADAAVVKQLVQEAWAHKAPRKKGA